MSPSAAVFLAPALDVVDREAVDLALPPILLVRGDPSRAGVLEEAMESIEIVPEVLGGVGYAYGLRFRFSARKLGLALSM